MVCVSCPAQEQNQPFEIVSLAGAGGACTIHGSFSSLPAHFQAAPVVMFVCRLAPWVCLRPVQHCPQEVCSSDLTALALARSLLTAANYAIGSLDSWELHSATQTRAVSGMIQVDASADMDLLMMANKTQKTSPRECNILSSGLLATHPIKQINKQTRCGNRKPSMQ